MQVNHWGLIPLLSIFLFMSFWMVKQYIAISNVFLFENDVTSGYASSDQMKQISPVGRMYTVKHNMI